MAGDSEADEKRCGPLDEIDAKHSKFVAEHVAADKCCGSCELFAHEDMNGNGWCNFHDGGAHCGSTCRHWTAKA